MNKTVVKVKLPAWILVICFVITSMMAGPMTAHAQETSGDIHVMDEIFPQINENSIDKTERQDTLPYRDGTKLLTVKEPFYLKLTAALENQSSSASAKMGVFGENATLMSKLSRENGYVMSEEIPTLGFDDITVIDGKNYSLELLSVITSCEGDFDGNGKEDEIAMIVGARTKGNAVSRRDMLLLCVADVKNIGAPTVVSVLYEDTSLSDGTLFADQDDWIAKMAIVCGDVNGDSKDEIITVAPMNTKLYCPTGNDGFYNRGYACIWYKNASSWQINPKTVYIGNGNGTGYPGKHATTYSLAVGDIDRDGYEDLISAESSFDSVSLSAVNLFYGSDSINSFANRYTILDYSIKSQLAGYQDSNDFGEGYGPANVNTMGGIGIAVSESANGSTPTIFVAFKDIRIGGGASPKLSIPFYGVIALDYNKDSSSYGNIDATYLHWGGLAVSEYDVSDDEAYRPLTIAESGFAYNREEIANQISCGSVMVDGIIFSYQKALDRNGYNYNFHFEERVAESIPDKYLYIKEAESDEEQDIRLTMYGCRVEDALMNADNSIVSIRSASVTGDSYGFMVHNTKSGQIDVQYYDSRNESDDLQTGFTRIFSKTFTKNDTSVIIAMPNTDEDSIYLKYKGHQFFWSDPVIIAALTSPPYFESLPGDNYTNGGTSYGKSTTMGSGQTETITTSLGSYITTEVSGGAFGISGVFESETEKMSNMTEETEAYKEITYTETFTTAGGENSVVLSTAAFDAYNYDAYYPAADGTMKTSPFTVVVPHGGAGAMLTTPLNYEDYLEILPYAEGVLPDLSDVFPEPGDPSSYPQSSVLSGENIANGSVISFKNNASFPANSGAISQEIEITRENTTVTATGTSISAKMGGGADAEGSFLDIIDVTSKITGGDISSVENERGLFVIDAEGMTFSGDVYGQGDGIGNESGSFDWKLMRYVYRSVQTETDANGIEKSYVQEFPVITYAVTGVQTPVGTIPTAVEVTSMGELNQVGPSTAGARSSTNLRIKADGITRESKIELVGQPHGMSLETETVTSADSYVGVAINSNVEPGSYDLKLSVGGVLSNRFTVMVNPYSGAEGIPTDKEYIVFPSVKPALDKTHTAAEEIITINNTTSDVLQLTVSVEGDDFEISTELSSSIINKNGTATIGVRPVPGLSEGTYNSALKLEDEYGAVAYIGLSFTVMPPTVPGEVTGVYDESAYPLNLYWSEPDDNGGFEITDYEITVEDVFVDAHGQQQWISTNGNALYVFDETGGFTQGNTYKIGIRAVNQLGSGKAKWITWCAETANPPSQIQNLSTHPGDGQVTLTWDHPVDLGSTEEIIIYKLRYMIFCYLDGELVSYTQPMYDTDYTVTGLENGKTYTFHVSAHNGYGSSSEIVNATPSYAVSTPSRPKKLRVDTEYGRAIINWDAPAYNGGSDITGYKLSVDGGNSWIDVASRSYTAENLVTNREYTFMVRAVNSRGDGAISQITICAPSDLEAPAFISTNGNGQIAITWNDPSTGELPQGYELQVNDGEWERITPYRIGSKYAYVLTNLVNGEEYTISLRGYNEEGGGAVYTGSFGLVPSDSYAPPVKNLHAEAGNGKVTITFDAPDDKEEYSYKISTNGSYWYSVSSGYEDIFLDNGTEYTYAVCVWKDGVQSVAYTSAIPDSSIPECPDYPNISVEIGDTYITAAWEEPDNGGSDILWYVVGDKENGERIPVSADTGSYTFHYPSESARKKVDNIFVGAVNSVGTTENNCWFDNTMSVEGKSEYVLKTGYNAVSEKYNILISGYEEGGEYSYYLFNEGDDPEFYQEHLWSITSDHPEITMDNETRSLHIAQGLPAGSYEVTLKFNFFNNSMVTYLYNITVIVCDEYEILTDVLPPALTGTVYEGIPLASNFGTAEWSLKSGTLPEGLVLGENGSITGIATTAGVYTFVVEAANGDANATKQLTITVEDTIENYGSVSITGIELDGNTIADKTVTVFLDISELPPGAQLFVAAYDDNGRLRELQCLDVTDKLTSDNTIVTKMNLTGAKKVKAMVWESASTLVPLCSAVDIEI